MCLYGIVSMIEISGVLHNRISTGRTRMRFIIVRYIPFPPIIITLKYRIFRSVFECTVFYQVTCRFRRVLGSQEHIFDIFLLCRCRKGKIPFFRFLTSYFIIIRRIGPLEISGSLVGWCQRDIFLGETNKVTIMRTESSGLRVIVCSNRRCRWMNSDHIRRLAFRCSAQELRMDSVRFGGRSIETFQFEGLRRLDIGIEHRDGVNIFTPNHQIAGILLVIKSDDTIDSASLVSHIRFRSDCHKRSDLTSTRCALRTILIQTNAHQATLGRSTALIEEIPIVSGSSQGDCVISLSYLNPLSSPRFQTNPVTPVIFKPCVVECSIRVVIVFRCENIFCPCCTRTNLFIVINP